MENSTIPTVFSPQQMSTLSFKDTLKYLLDLEYYLDLKIDKVNKTWVINQEQVLQHSQIISRCYTILQNYVDIAETHPNQELSVQDLCYFTQIACDPNVKSINTKLLFNAFQRALPQLAGNSVLRGLACVYINFEFINNLALTTSQKTFNDFLEQFDDITFLDFVVYPIFGMNSSKVQECVDYTDIKRNAEKFDITQLNESVILYFLERLSILALSDRGKVLNKAYYIVIQALCRNEFQMLNQLNEKHRDTLWRFLDSLRVLANIAMKQTTLFKFSTNGSELFDTSYYGVLDWFYSLALSENKRLLLIAEKRLKPCFEHTRSFFNVLNDLVLVLYHYPQLEKMANDMMAKFIVDQLELNQLKESDIPFSHPYFHADSRIKLVVNTIVRYYYWRLNLSDGSETSESVFERFKNENLLDILNFIRALDRTMVIHNLDVSDELQSLIAFHYRYAEDCRQLAQKRLIDSFNDMPKFPKFQEEPNSVVFQSVNDTISQEVDVDFSKFQWQ